MSMQLLRAAPYVINGRSQLGKMHAIRESGRTFCGTEYQYTSGDILDGERDEVTCKACLRSMDSRDRMQETRERWQGEREQRDREWWAWYSAYLETPEWAARRQLVFLRARGVCEGCRSASPTHVHHLTYEHAGDELLYELVALCQPCHQRAHPAKDISGAA